MVTESENIYEIKGGEAEKVLKSSIPIIQAERDRQFTAEQQKDLIIGRERLMKETKEKILAGIAGLEKLGFDPKKIAVEYGFEVLAFDHALFKPEFVTRFVHATLAELPKLIEEQHDYVRRHDLRPSGAPWFRFRQIDLAEPISEDNKKSAWAAGARSEGKVFLEKFFEAMKAFFPVFDTGLNNLFVTRFVWQTLNLANT